MGHSPTMAHALLLAVTVLAACCCTSVNAAGARMILREPPRPSGRRLLGFFDVFACVWRPTPDTATPDADGRLWGWENGRSCAFRWGSRPLFYTGYEPGSWVLTPACTSTTFAIDSVTDSKFKTWGWENGRLCAYKDDHLQPISISLLAARLEWSDAPPCTASPGATNAAPDKQGRLWGWQLDRNCAFKAADGSPIYYDSYTGPRYVAATPTPAAPVPSLPSPSPSPVAPSPSPAARSPSPGGAACGNTAQLAEAIAQSLYEKIAAKSNLYESLPDMVDKAAQDATANVLAAEAFVEEAGNEPGATPLEAVGRKPATPRYSAGQVDALFDAPTPDVAAAQADDISAAEAGAAPPPRPAAPAAPKAQQKNATAPRTRSRRAAEDTTAQPAASPSPASTLADTGIADAASGPATAPAANPVGPNRIEDSLAKAAQAGASPAPTDQELASDAGSRGAAEEASVQASASPSPATAPAVAKTTAPASPSPATTPNADPVAPDLIKDSLAKALAAGAGLHEAAPTNQQQASDPGPQRIGDTLAKVVKPTAPAGNGGPTIVGDVLGKTQTAVGAAVDKAATQSSQSQSSSLGSLLNDGGPGGVSPPGTHGTAGEVTSTPLPPDAITNTTNTTAPVAAEDIKAAEADTAPVAVAVPEPTYSYSAAGITSPGTRGSRNQIILMPGAGSDITAASDDSAVDYAPMGPTSRGGNGARAVPGSRVLPRPAELGVSPLLVSPSPVVPAAAVVPPAAVPLAAVATASPQPALAVAQPEPAAPPTAPNATITPVTGLRRLAASSTATPEVQQRPEVTTKAAAQSESNTDTEKTSQSGAWAGGDANATAGTASARAGAFAAQQSRTKSSASANASASANVTNPDGSYSYSWSNSSASSWSTSWNSSWSVAYSEANASCGGPNSSTAGCDAAAAAVARAHAGDTEAGAGAAAATHKDDGQAKHRRLSDAGDPWFSTQVCDVKADGPNTVSNVTRDWLGRYYGYQNGGSCAFRDVPFADLQYAQTAPFDSPTFQASPPCPLGAPGASLGTDGHRYGWEDTLKATCTFDKPHPTRPLGAKDPIPNLTPPKAADPSPSPAPQSYRVAPPDELPTQPASPQPDLTPAPIAVPASPASPELASDALADSELAPQQARRTSSAGPATKPAVVGLAGLVKSSPTLDASPPAAEAASVPALEPVLAPGPSATKVPVFSAAEGGSRAGAAAPHPNATAAAVTPAAAAADQAAADEASAGTESGDLSQSIVAEGVKSMAALARAGAEASTMISKATSDAAKIMRALDDQVQQALSGENMTDTTTPSSPIPRASALAPNIVNIDQNWASIRRGPRTQAGSSGAAANKTSPKPSAAPKSPSPRPHVPAKPSAPASPGAPASPEAPALPAADGPPAAPVAASAQPAGPDAPAATAAPVVPAAAEAPAAAAAPATGAALASPDAAPASPAAPEPATVTAPAAAGPAAASAGAESPAPAPEATSEPSAAAGGAADALSTSDSDTNSRLRDLDARVAAMAVRQRIPDGSPALP